MSGIYECECDSFEMIEEQDAFSMNEGIPGPGVPAGGSAGQVLRKKSAESYDTEWDTLTADDIPYGNQTVGDELEDLWFSFDQLGDEMLNKADASSIAETDFNPVIYDHEKGSYFLINGLLYQAITDISAGDTITTSGANPNAKQAVLGDDVCDVKNTLNRKADLIYDTASGDIASFPDGADGLPVKDLTVGIEPVQDLHGYDNPWPGGGSSNKWDEVTESGTISDAGDEISNPDYLRSKNYCSCVGGNQYYVKAEYRVDICCYDSNKVFIEKIKNKVNTTFTASTNASFFRLILYTNTYSNNVAVNYPATVTTYSPYSNICPISGWTGANVTRAGKNLCPNAFYPYGLSSDYTITKNADGSVSLTGTYTSTSNTVIKNALFTLPAGSYILSGMLDMEWVGLSLQLQKSVTSTVIGYAGYAGNVAFTLAETTQLEVRIFISGATAKDVPLDNYTIHPMIIRQDEQDTSFEGYQGTVYPIAFPSGTTVYGGTLDVTSGALTVDRIAVEYDGSNDESWSINQDSNFTIAKPTGVVNDFGISNIYKFTTSTPMPDYSFRIGSNNLLVHSLVDTVANWRTYLQSNPLTIVYKLNSPQTVTLTVTEIETLLGQNNIWADCGPSTVEYPCDTKLYIDKKLAALVAALS